MLEGFARALSEAGYAALIARRHLRAAEHFIYWSDRQGMSVSKWKEQSLVGFGHHLGRCHRSDSDHTYQLRVVRGARLFLTWLRNARIITSVDPSIHDPDLLSAFRQWMRQQRGTSEKTLCNHGIHIREFLRRLGEEPSRYDARRLRSFVLKKSCSCGVDKVKRCTTALRMFLRFLIARGQCPVGLDAAIPTVAHWRLASLPRYLPQEDVERLIASCDRASAVGRRDRAILLLLARLGLRAGDIVHLRLSDIDWKNASIQVCGKSRHPMRLPLTQEVGQAIVIYLKEVRPRTNADAVFIHCRAPFFPLASCTVSMIVAKALRRAGVVRPSRGAAHLLRHSLATSLLRQGASLQDIATILRHRSLETTQIYAKVDIPSLRQIAQRWPEV
jgi:integrase/recombinase XerD